MCPPPTGGAQHAGQAEKQTVLQLKPVRYQVSLIYLGHNRIAHKKGTYTCKYELHRGNNPIPAGPDLIANRIRPADTDARSWSAALPYAHGGDNRNPVNEEVFRVVITDNHGLRTSENGLLGRPDGDNKSKPKYFEERGWMPDLKPAVPFRVVVKKFVGEEQVDIKDKLRVVVEVKDPREEFDVNNGTYVANRRPFLQGFFDKYNRTDTKPTPGDDNALKRFSGIREGSAPRPGVNAVDVLKKVPYVNTPVAEAGVCPADAVQFSQLAAASKYGTARAKFNCEEVTSDGFKVGVADFVFAPPPVSGDNYRFLITLRDDSDKDVRKKKENGVNVQMVDATNTRIFPEKAYTTGRFVMWRKSVIRLLVTCNGVSAAEIDWDWIRTVYRQNFIEVEGPRVPQDVFAIDRPTWRTLLRNHFDPAGTNASYNNNANFSQARFTTSLLPLFQQTNAVTSADVRELAKLMIKHACDNTPGLQDPGANLDQENSEGFFIAYFLPPGMPTFSVVGASFGNRSFWFDRMSGGNAVQNTSNTVAHEMGHALSLRHGHTNYPTVDFENAGGVHKNIQLADGRANNQIGDHDQSDAFNCIMSYTGPDNAEFCGLCHLTLRFFDRIEVTKAGRYREQTLAGLTPARIVMVDATDDGAGNKTLNGLKQAVPAMTKTDTMDLMCLGPEKNFRDANTAAADPALVGRANISCAADAPATLWSVSPAGIVDLATSGPTPTAAHDRVTITGKKKGNVKIKYKKDNVTAEVTVTVTD